MGSRRGKAVLLNLQQERALVETVIVLEERLQALQRNLSPRKKAEVVRLMVQECLEHPDELPFDVAHRLLKE